MPMRCHMLLTIAILTSALVILTTKYARKRIEVSELRSELCGVLIRSARELDAARTEAAALRRENNALYAALLPAPEQPESIAARTAAKIAAERAEESNVYGVKL